MQRPAWIVSVLAVTIPYVTAAEVVRVDVTQDTYLSQGSSGPHCADPELFVGHAPGNDEYSIVWFDLPQHSCDAGYFHCVDAELRLHLLSDLAEGYDVSAYRITSTWSESDCPYPFHNTPTHRDSMDTDRMPNSPGQMEWNISCAVSAWYNNPGGPRPPCGRFGILLKTPMGQDNPSPNGRFASSEHSDPTKRPYVQLEFECKPADNTNTCGALLDCFEDPFDPVCGEHRGRDPYCCPTGVWEAEYEVLSIAFDDTLYHPGETATITVQATNYVGQKTALRLILTLIPNVANIPDIGGIEELDPQEFELLPGNTTERTFHLTVPDLGGDANAVFFWDARAVIRSAADGSLLTFKELDLDIVSTDLREEDIAKTRQALIACQYGAACFHSALSTLPYTWTIDALNAEEHVRCLAEQFHRDGDEVLASVLVVIESYQRIMGVLDPFDLFLDLAGVSLLGGVANPILLANVVSAATVCALDLTNWPSPLSGAQTSGQFISELADSAFVASRSALADYSNQIFIAGQVDLRILVDGAFASVDSTGINAATVWQLPRHSSTWAYVGREPERLGVGGSPNPNEACRVEIRPISGATVVALVILHTFRTGESETAVTLRYGTPDDPRGPIPVGPSSLLEVELVNTTDRPALFVDGNRWDPIVPVTLTGLHAAVEDGAVRIRWNVHDEVFLGFLLYRAEGATPHEGAFRIVNREQLIPGSGPWEYLDRDVVPATTYAYKVSGVLPSGASETIGPIVATLPPITNFTLLAGHPNPMRGDAELTFDAPRESEIRLVVYDLAGRSVRNLLKGWTPLGRHRVVWNGRNDKGQQVASGVYIVRLTWDGGSINNRLALLR